MDFKELMLKSKKKNGDGEPLKLAVLGDTATQNIVVALKGLSNIYKYNCSIYESDFDQVDLELLNPASGYHTFCADVTLLYLSSEKLYHTFCSLSLVDKANFASMMLEKIKDYWQIISQNGKTKIIQPDFAEYDDRCFGNFGLNLNISFIYQIRKLNYLILEAAKSFKNIFFVNLNYVQDALSESNTHNEKLYCLAKMPLTLEAVTELAKNVFDIINAVKGRIKKCVVLDLDNTLWGGVVGDDGVNNLKIGSLGNGYAFSEFQLWLKQLKERGILLAVCSKNNEDKAKEPFQVLGDMVLKLDDFSIFVANWNDKASNIKFIQQNLNLGMDSFVFIDDNKFERELVKSVIPEITVPDMPDDPAEYIGYLRSLNLFETISFSENDAQRTSQYQAEVKRNILKNDVKSVDDYLNSLSMIAIYDKFDEENLSRIAQLSQRSNQFNLRTVRYTEADVKKIMEDKNYHTFYFKLSDKFGDYGLISVLSMFEKKPKELFIENWFMSCRILKRGMEEYIINKIVDYANKNGFEKIIGEYIESQKNAMVKDIYSQMGFSKVSENLYELDVLKYNTKKTFIMDGDEK